ncbi:MAG: hypothetical protein QOF33_2675 [Thermomicrobiales bacterium]|jgi:hypothetical protein|nr:hypothetical protein [Thermomicrobiales bacterium]MEA2584590.1 hypothetical protein [Thermomicrobiales bacterium]MEA2597197.1 hypothetical protein [Thermomicrobiales bacterium]
MGDAAIRPEAYQTPMPVLRAGVRHAGTGGQGFVHASSRRL